MALPQSVQHAADLADSIEKSILGEGAGQPTEVVAEPTTATEKVTEQPAISPVEENQHDELKKFQDRYRSLRGKYDAEVPRLNEDNRNLREQIARLQEENRAAKELLQKHESEKSYLTEQDVESFGADMVDMAKRAASEMTRDQNRRTAELERKLALMEQQLQEAKQASEQSAKAEFERQITSVCPEWIELNTDEGFNAWLESEDPTYGVTRKVPFTNAVQARDGIRTGKIFKLYADSLKKQKPDPLAKQVTPDHRAAAPAPQPQRAKWRESDIVKFFNDASRGRIPREQAEKIEQEINEAIATGNVLKGA